MLDKDIRFSDGIQLQANGLKFTFDKKQVGEIRDELEKIKAKNYDIGEVSDAMKRMVIVVFGDEDWSTSGYWIRAREIVTRFYMDVR